MATRPESCAGVDINFSLDHTGVRIEVANLERAGHPAEHLWAPTIERRATVRAKDTSGTYCEHETHPLLQNVRL